MAKKWPFLGVDFWGSKMTIFLTFSCFPTFSTFLMTKNAKKWQHDFKKWQKSETEHQFLRCSRELFFGTPQKGGPPASLSNRWIGTRKPDDRNDIGKTCSFFKKVYTSCTRLFWAQIILAKIKIFFKKVIFAQLFDRIGGVYTIIIFFDFFDMQKHEKHEKVKKVQKTLFLGTPWGRPILTPFLAIFGGPPKSTIFAIFSTFWNNKLISKNWEEFL